MIGDFGGQHLRAVGEFGSRQSREREPGREDRVGFRVHLFERPHPAPGAGQQDFPIAQAEFTLDECVQFLWFPAQQQALSRLFSMLLENRRLLLVNELIQLRLA